MKKSDVNTNYTVAISPIMVPAEVNNVCSTLLSNGFQAYIVGGCVRDLILNKKPNDWDITTNASTDQIISLFPKTFYENTFGTVGVVTENPSYPELEIIEVTPYRKEIGYSDNRHPDKVEFVSDITEDLKRRDFTINAMAAEVKDGSISSVLDMFGGIKDIKDKTIRCVNDPKDRFTEDSLRIIRAVRFASQLGFSIESKTLEAIVSCGTLLANVSRERIKDEFIKIVMSKNPMIGLFTMQKLGILRFIAPELEKCVGVTQNQAHKYDVWEHLLRSLQCAADKEYPLETRLAALFHDISKPETKRVSHETKLPTFYGHEVVGSRVTKKILENLKFPKKIIDKVVIMVRWHMFFSDTESITLSAVRRMISNVGTENIWDLMNLRICDRIGTGRPKEDPYRLRKYHAMIDEALRSPISVSMLAIDGKGIMDVTHETPGPKIGLILNALMEEVLEDSNLNTKEYLEDKAKKLALLPEKELKELADKGKKLKEEQENIELGKIKAKHHV